MCDCFDSDWVKKHFENIFNGFVQCDLGNDNTALLYNFSNFKTNKDNKYIAEFSFPCFITADMIDIDVIDEKRTLTISTHFKDDNGGETSSATMELLPDDADISSLVASFDNGKLMLTMNKLTKETTQKQ